MVPVNWLKDSTSSRIFLKMEGAEMDVIIRNGEWCQVSVSCHEVSPLGGMARSSFTLSYQRLYSFGGEKAVKPVIGQIMFCGLNIHWS